MSSTTPDATPKVVLTPVERYLAMYNQFSAILWSFILMSTTVLAVRNGQPDVFDTTNFALTVIQSFAVMEIINAIMGFVRTPIFTTVSQVASRLLIVYGIFRMLPNSPAGHHWSYLTLTFAWSVTEIVRYSYYAQNLITKGNPARFLTLLRYNLFFVLYPLGVFSELCIIYLSLDEAKAAIGAEYYYILIGSMALYAPGFYTLFGHMLKQRKKTMKALYAKEAGEKKQN
ncbi:hypothetical protein WICPIJ_004306 [Wickerhamomyces pijperi]|uniref:Very-long-chain (3R)-3-hydroxyacyl-CoA dehydratase n=1 Tax=Wickerhamomyces pijperi TaxID=599730 RepID=A0A9P8Q7X0_WICPI|nr:hypothetical protein WICPIJ_004306 [Wickerhamomyces pijperi]